MESGLSTGDLALMNRDNNGCGWGNDGMAFMWIFALLILAGGGFNGFGNNRVGEAYATQADIQRAVDLSSIQRGQADIAADIQRTNYEQIAATKDAAYNNLGEIRDIGAAVSLGNSNLVNNINSLHADVQSCCCTTQRAIDSVNYNIATHSAAIQANDTANTQKILDAIATNRMADMQNQINQLQLQNAVFGVVRYPMATTYCSGINPFAGNCSCSTTSTTTT